MEIQGPPPVGHGPAGPVAGQVGAPGQAAGATKTSSTEIIQTRSSSLILPGQHEQSLLRAMLEQLNALQLAEMILKLLLDGDREEKDKSSDPLRMLALAGLLAEEKRSGGLVFTETISTRSIEKVVAGYTPNVQSPQTAADPASQSAATGASSAPVQGIDVQA